MRDKPKNTERLQLSADFETVTAEHWQDAARNLLKGRPISEMTTRTFEGIALAPIYHRSESRAKPSPVKLSKAAHGWHICQALAFEEPLKFNQELQSALNSGQDTVYLILRSRPGGGDSAPLINSLPELEQSLQDIDLTSTPVMVQAGSDGIAALSLLLAHCERNEFKPEALTGALLFDPFLDLIVGGTLPAATEVLFEDLAALTRWCSQNAPNFKTIGVDTTPYSEAGSTATHELAFAIATGAEYLRKSVDAAGDLTVSAIAEKMLFSFAAGPDFFTQIAKLRAARLLWANVLSAFGANRHTMTIHARTTQWNKSALDPHVNILRGTTEALSAVLGGCDSLYVVPFDEAAGGHSESATRLARNTQLILRDEVQLGQVMDPASGSWYIEELTTQLAQDAWHVFQKIEEKGGMLSALISGFPQQLVADSAQRRMESVQCRRYVLIGTNKYPNLMDDESRPVPHAQKELRANGSGRSEITFHRQKTFANTLAKLIDTFKGGAALSDVSEAVNPAARQVRVEPVIAVHASKSFEILRQATAKYEARSKAQLAATVVGIGPVRDYQARADFVADFMQIAGIETMHIEADSQPSLPDSKIFILCGRDDAYPDAVPSLVTRLKSRSPNAVILLAGKPGSNQTVFKQVGIEDFIFQEVNAIKVLTKVLRRIGVLNENIS